MTIAARHNLGKTYPNFKNVEKRRPVFGTNARRAKDEKPLVIFVVPTEIFSSFQIKGWGRSKLNVEVWVMEVEM
jgi:hypothetical protein